MEARPIPDELWKELRQKTKITHVTMIDAIRSQILNWTLEDTKAHRDELVEHAVRHVATLDTDMINEIVFGITAKEWKAANPNLKGNMRDYATKDQLELIYYLERQNTLYSRRNIDHILRTPWLRDRAEIFKAQQKERAENGRLRRLQINFRKRVESGEYYQKDNTWYDRETGRPVLLVPKEW